MGCLLCSSRQLTWFKYMYIYFLSCYFVKFYSWGITNCSTPRCLIINIFSNPDLEFAMRGFRVLRWYAFSSPCSNCWMLILILQYFNTTMELFHEIYHVSHLLTARRCSRFCYYQTRFLLFIAHRFRAIYVAIRIRITYSKRKVISSLLWGLSYVVWFPTDFPCSTSNFPSFHRNRGSRMPT